MTISTRPVPNHADLLIPFMIPTDVRSAFLEFHTIKSAQSLKPMSGIFISFGPTFVNQDAVLMSARICHFDRQCMPFQARKIPPPNTGQGHYRLLLASMDDVCRSHSNRPLFLSLLSSPAFTTRKACILVLVPLLGHRGHSKLF